MSGKRKIIIIPKNKKCRCGKKITHHHFLCNDCWKLDKKTSKLRKEAMKENIKKIKKLNKKEDKNGNERTRFDGTKAT